MWYLIVWLGIVPVEQTDGSIAFTEGRATSMGEYDSFARCEQDRKIFIDYRAKCLPRAYVKLQ